ncbi:serine/threonine-protein kinase [Fibrella arboris]|uniref:serine/threonine-protein kinase n=1 Tax=Fibrella arboris TaxID=3242486 RepID=UPI00352120E1
MEYRKQQFLTYDEFTRQFACDYAMPLARGGHGEIYRGVDLETNEEVAIKRRLYSVDDNALTLEKEYANTQAVPVNRFVVRYLYYGRYATPFGTYEFLVMRFYRDGNLTSTALSWSSLSNLQQQRFVSEFLLGLSHLHTHGIVHRDIKPENVLLVRYSDSEGIAFRPVIVDFGISKMMTDYPEAARAFVQNSMRIGTVTYMAPEQLHTENIDYNADLWSFGIILYELITGKHMIARKSFPETQREEAYSFWKLANEERFPDDLQAIPQPYQQMVRKCLIVSSEERIQSARALLDLLELQPRIIDAEKAFRSQQWDGVIEALDPIIDKADIPELTVWLQQARMQSALAQPIELLVEAPSPTHADGLVDDEPIEEGDRNPELVANVPTEPDKQQEPVGVPYLDQTELLEEPAEPLFNRKRTVTTDEVVVDEAPEKEQPGGSLETTRDQDLSTSDTLTEEDTAGQATLATTLKEAVVDLPMTDARVDELPEEEVTTETASEPDTGELTEAFSDEPIADQPSPVKASATERVEASVADSTEVNVPESTDQSNEPVVEHAAQPAYIPETETFTDMSAQTAAGNGGQPTQLVDIPSFVAPDQAAYEPLREAPTSGRLQKVLDGFSVERVRQRAGELYSAAKMSKNRPLLIGGGVAVVLLLLFAIDPEGPGTGTVVQLDPNESYETSLKRFQTYSRTYEKTGNLDPYVWAFVHCNPTYDDSLVQSAVRRAEAVLAQNQLLFPDYEGNIAGLKRLEMRYMLKDKIGWEVRPHNLSDENCLPKK